MRLLSAGRRHRFAGVVVTLFALVVLGGTYAAIAPQQRAAADAAAQATQIEEGRKLFAVSCTSCHGLNAEGSREAPSLIGVGAAAVDFQVGTGRMPAQQPGPQMPRKKVIFTDEEIAALAAYVASLGPGPSVPAPEQYEPDGLSDADIAEGGELFRTNCTACHNVAGKGGALPWGKYAPKLGGVDPKHIYEAMLTGPQQMPVFSDEVMTPEEKKKLIGYVEEITTAPSQGGFDLGSLGPVTEGLATWLIGLAVLVLVAIWIAAKGARVKK